MVYNYSYGPVMAALDLQVEARKLEYDRPPTPKPREEAQAYGLWPMRASERHRCESEKHNVDGLQHCQAFVRLTLNLECQQLLPRHLSKRPPGIPDEGVHDVS